VSVRSRSLSVAAGTPLQVARPVAQGTRIEEAEAVRELLVDEDAIVNVDRIGAGCNPGGRIPRSCLLHSNARGGGELRGVLIRTSTWEARLAAVRASHGEGSYS